MRNTKPTPKKKPNRRPWKERFLKAFRLTGNVRQAALAAGVERCQPYHVFDKDPEFKAAFEEAREHAADRLEQEAFRRAHDGLRKPIAVNGKTHWVREYSDTLLIFLLKASRPHKYRDNHQIALSNADGSNIQIDARHQVQNLFLTSPEAAQHLIALANLTCPKDEPQAALPAPPPAPGANGTNGAHASNGNGSNGANGAH
jgi:hypothetical protein